MTENIKEKIRKLLTLASSTNNPGEADVAFTKAQILMDTYRIEMSDIEEKKQEPYIKDMDNPILFGKRIARWKMSLAVVLATYNNCYPVTYQGYFGQKLILFGRQDDIEHVRWIFGYCIIQLNTYSSVGCLGHDRSFKNSWLNGAVAGIRSKLQEGRRLAAEQTAGQTGGASMGLVKLNDEFEKVKQFAHSLDSISEAKAQRTSYDSEAYNSGFKTGKNVNVSGRPNANVRGTLGDSMAEKDFVYFDNCVHLNARDLHGMIDNAIEVQWHTFAKHCDYIPLEKQISSGIKFKNDWAVSFYKSKFKGRDCYYLRHSSIEYIFMRRDGK